MGHESIVYGAIVGSSWKISEPDRLQRLNQQVIAGLPETDDWPFLTRAMFACAGDSVLTGRYRSQPIFFGATFKAVEWEWDQWLAKFEQLLARLFWDEVYLHLRTEATVGDYVYVYRADTDDQFYQREPPLPISAWTFSGGPRAFDFNAASEAGAAEQTWRYAAGVWQLAGEP
jgi:hypothetical protein